MKKTKDVLTKNFIFLIIALIFLTFILILLTVNTVQAATCKFTLENSIVDFAEKNEEIIFSINNCTFFSSADSKDKQSSVTNFTIENLYQYTDIALYINNNSDTPTLKNTLKSVYINNISFTKTPKLGSPGLYYKSINDFAKSNFVDNNKIENQLDFKISSEDNLNFDTPCLYNNCASPIVLSYVNTNIKNDYTITNTSSPITYDGSLLKQLSVPLDSISCSLAFDIYIVNNLNEEFKSTVSFDIPLSNESTSIYDGKYLEKKNTNYIFYRYK